MAKTPKPGTRQRCPTCHQLYTPVVTVEDRYRMGGVALRDQKFAEDPEYFQKLGKRGGRPKHQRYPQQESAGRPAGASVTRRGRARG